MAGPDAGKKITCMGNSIREQFSKYANFKNAMWGHRDFGKLPPALENMAIEVYNPGGEEITFFSVHPEWQKMHFFGFTPDYWKVLKCMPGEWVFLPHAQYIPSIPSGDQNYPVVVNVGDMMFKGNKLPSRPDGPAKVRVFT